MRVLVVCTANRCRSPMAAGLLVSDLARLGVADVEVTSAGFGPAGEPAMAQAVEVMAEVGIDLSGHRSVGISSAQCERADLIIGMTRRHVMDLVLLAPAAWPVTFPLVGLTRRVEEVGPVRPGEDRRTWVGRVHGGRERRDIVGIKAADEIADPVGLPRRAFERTRRQLDLLLRPLAQSLASGPPDPRDRARGPD